MPPKKSSCSPDADALPEAVERLSDEVRTLRTALDEFQDSFAFELRRIRDVLAEVVGHRPEVNAEDPAMAIDGVRSAARQVERAAEFPRETSAADQNNSMRQTAPEAAAMTADPQSSSSAVSPGDPQSARLHTGSAGKLF